VEWNHCRFNITSFADHTTFESCRFIDCRFWGQHTHLGGPSIFVDCLFEGCRFEDVNFWASTFERCVFTSRFENVAFFGPEAPSDWRTVFRSVDLAGSEFELVDFRCGFDLTTTTLPSDA
jgi:uncharacterized protein YjbI with pentapeptide repeats